MTAHSDYFDPSQYEPTIGPIEEEFCAMLDDFQADVEAKAWYDENPPTEPDNAANYVQLKKAVMEGHAKLVTFVSDLEVRLAAAVALEPPSGERSARIDAPAIAASPELADKKALVLYFNNDEDRDYVIAACREAMPNAHTVETP